MLTVSRNHIRFTCSYDGNGERVTDGPDLIVDDAPPSPVLFCSPTAADGVGAITSNSSTLAGERYLYQADYLATDANLDLGPCRCGGRFGEGRFLSADPVVFAGHDPNLYRYVSDAPPSADLEDLP